ncbi:MAG: helix-turn-helix transcriptional regulator [Prochloron sp. SP5CPC1]|nr:helix-turn-helix transcriptional regulator [Candidatus Paraprochloron terpiosi SP5CPC1]
MSYFAERFQEWCHDKGLVSDYQLAKLSYLNRDTISKIINNPVLNPCQSTLKKIATAFSKKTGNSVDEELEELEKFWADNEKNLRGKGKAQKATSKTGLVDCFGD